MTGAAARSLRDSVHGSARLGSGGDSGSAVVEFVALGALLLLPIVYLVLTLGRLQAAAFAADGAAREAARAYVTAPDDPTARARAKSAVRLGLLDQGFDVDAGQVASVRCSADPCLTPQAQVTVDIAIPVVLPGVPGFLDRLIPTHVTVRASQLAVVDAFRVGPGEQ